MEKWTPDCKLPLVKALVEAGKIRTTFTALAGGAALGLDFEGTCTAPLPRSVRST